MARLLKIILLLNLFSLPLYAQRIVEVDITGDETALPRIEISTTAGTEFSPELVGKDVKRLYSTGRYSYVEAVSEETGEGIKVVFTLIRRYLVKQVIIRGNSAVDEKDIKEKLTIKEGDLLDRFQVWQSTRAIEALYREKDHPIVRVKPEIKTYPDSETCTVVFNIKEFKNVYIARINFVGNENFSDEELLKILSISPRTSFSWLSGSGIYDSGKLKEQKERLVAFYMDHGYIDVQVSDPVIRFSPDRKFVVITFEVKEGPQYRVGSISLAGDLIFDRLKIMEKLQLKEGEVFSRSKLSMDVFTIVNMYKNVGFFFAQVTPIPSVDKENHIVSIMYKITKGKPVFVRFIRITGNTKTRDKVIRRQMLIREGELFSGEKLRKSRERIFALGYFEEVNVRVETVKGFDNLIDIVVEVKERPTGTASAGIAYSSVDKLVGTLQLSFGNFRGMGQKLTLVAEFGAYKKNYNLSFEDPYFLDSNWGMTTSIYNTQRVYTSYTENLAGGSLGVSYHLTIYSMFYLTYSYRDVNITTGTEGAMSYYTAGRTGSLTTSLVYNSKNHPFDPTRGLYSRLSMEYGSKYLGGEYDFLKTVFSTSYYFTPVWELTFMVHGEIGEIVSLTGEELPFSEKFLLGGIYSVRGYDYMSIGPRELVPYTTDSPIYSTTLVNLGGNKELLFNFEILFPIIKEAGLKGVLFFDAGNAYSEEEEFLARPLQMAYGWGFRWFSPMGPLRFEWGYPLNPREGDRSHVFEFSVGTFF